MMAAGSVMSRRSPLLSILFYVVLAVAGVAASAAPQTPVAAAHKIIKANATADELYWAKREQIAGSYNRGAFVSDPIETMNRFNNDVLKSIENDTSVNGGRRSLRRAYKGPCVATNPIDQCWRCKDDWAKNRKQLAKCAMGFGHRTIGGYNGKLYVVNDSSDDLLNMISPRKGTLRYGVVQDRPLWIVFKRDMIITLSNELIVNSDKTIDGRGAQVHIKGAQITVQNVRNVIIHNLYIHHAVPHFGGLIRDSKHHFGMRAKSDGDGISIMGSSNVWIDHVSMYNCTDGLIDVTDGSTAITISNGHFTKHDHVMLFGGSNDLPKDKIMQITVAFNHFGKGLVQRMPRCRFGFFHVVNNDYTHWLMYAIGGNMNPTIISQGNRFRAVDDSRFKEVTHRENPNYNEYKNWVWKSQDDVFLNGAFFNQSGGQNERVFDKLDFIAAKSGHYVKELTKFAGALNCRKGKKC